MANTKIAASEAQAALNAVVDAIDGGTGAGVLKVYAGTQPADPDATPGTATLLASMTLQSPAFGTAADAGGSATATVNGTPSDTSANASGTATWFRAETSGGAGVIDGDAGTATADDLTLDSANISAGATVTVNSWKVTIPQ